MLLWLLVILLAAAPVSWGLAILHPRYARWSSLIALLIDGVLVLAIWADGGNASGMWIQEIRFPWIPPLGAELHLAADGISITLLALTIFLGIMAIACSWNDITEKVGFFHCNLLLALAGICGVFVAIDLFLFYFAWELMLIPTYFLIALWGHEHRQYAATKFFIFTQLGGLFLLASIISLYCIHGQQTSHYTFDYQQLLGTSLSPAASMWLMIGFIIAFFVKLPVIPFHTWLPDAHTEAPTAGSVILAGLLLKTGAYGLIRFVLPFFPASASLFAPIAWGLGIAGIIYGAGMAFAQNDVKRLIAYSSISHMGFVLLGIFSGTTLGLQGAMIAILAHGITTGSLFIMAGDLQSRIHTRDMIRMGGLWSDAPALGAIALFFAVASVGLPGLGNFVGEFLVLLGIYHASIPSAVLASFGFVLSVVYAVWMMQKVFFGEKSNNEKIRDLSRRELGIYSCMMTAILLLGLFPSPFFRILDPAISKIVEVSDGKGEVRIR